MLNPRQVITALKHNIGKVIVAPMGGEASAAEQDTP